jgi:ATP-dependent Clp protease ATP-binding subunit ClpC
VHNRFTEQARQVWRFAEQEANDLYSEYLGTEHLLLGLIREESGIAARIFKGHGVDLRRLRLEVGKINAPPPETVVPVPRPITPMAQRVLARATQEAGAQQHVGTGHLLLGLLGDSETQAAQILMDLGLTLEAVRREVFDVLMHGCHAANNNGYDERAAIQNNPTAALQFAPTHPA